MSFHDATFYQSTGIKHYDKMFCVMRTSIGTNESSYIFNFVGLYTYGGGDHNHKHVQNHFAPFRPFLLGSMDKINVKRGCPGLSFLNKAERSLDFLNNGLSGILLKFNL